MRKVLRKRALVQRTSLLQDGVTDLGKLISSLALLKNIQRVFLLFILFNVFVLHTNYFVCGL